MIIPAGIVIYIALNNTNIVLSKIDLRIVFSILGFLYGGSSSVNPDDSFFKIVFERIFDIISVISIEIMIIASRSSAAEIEEVNLLVVFDIRKIDIIAISVGNLPLQGEKTFVNIAISFSFFDFIILHPITPQALQPYPMHIVSACFPFVPHFLKVLSRLNAILGK